MLLSRLISYSIRRHRHECSVVIVVIVTIASTAAQGEHSPGGLEYHVTNLRPFLEAI